MPDGAPTAPAAGVAWLKDFVRDVPDFPRPGIVFKDITPLLADAGAFAAAIDALAHSADDHGPIHKVVGIEARGFIFAAPLARVLGAGFVPVRKAGKLPWRTHAQDYDLEYGTDRVEVHSDAFVPGDRVLVADDVLATGGTAAATVRLLDAVGVEVASLAFLIELAFLGGRSRLDGHEPTALLTYD